ncbi:Glycerol-3-phosphate dehydrogenase [NAD(P)+] [Frankliniella fusca]|uniref:Glycerol-3-phosphate dehydrogenase [NAD(P)+] n=1 Tax=Frankliniella fusca TaxID=407009 RepID=A0AAE1HS59_9NEOP|nr:Glycerol-3-phosphate dehydrogenase [NAD(P)+] [Frankliniella fusca]
MKDHLVQKQCLQFSWSMDGIRHLCNSDLETRKKLADQNGVELCSQINSFNVGHLISAAEAVKNIVGRPRKSQREIRVIFDVHSTFGKTLPPHNSVQSEVGENFVT